MNTGINNRKIDNKNPGDPVSVRSRTLTGGKAKLGKKGIALALMALITLAACAFRPVNVVVISLDSGEIIRHTVAKDTLITLHFVHSYYRVPQYENYRISGDSLVLDEIWFGDLQAANYWNPDIRYLYDEATGFYYLKDIGGRIDRHIFSMAHRTQYSISVGSRTYDLNKAFPNAHIMTTTAGAKPWIACLNYYAAE